MIFAENKHNQEIKKKKKWKLEVRDSPASNYNGYLAVSKKMKKTMNIIVELLRKKNILYKDQKIEWERKVCNGLAAKGHF